MIVRELLTLLGFTVDKASYDRASKQYDAMADRAQANAKAVQQAAGATGKFGQQAQQAAKGTGLLKQALGMFQRFNAQDKITGLLKQYTTLASDANETRGALGQLFGQENIGAIETWSQVQGKAMGRSEYDLQKYAAGIGAVLGPVTESREEAQRMAQSMSELAVDLGSFFNTTDETAMASLRAGLTGEYESLKKYGIVLNDTTLEEIAFKQGLKKKVTQMTIAEKTQLRYAAIIDRSAAAHGDAIRTSEGFANSTKALKAQLKTLGINAGKKVLPVLEKFVHWGREAVVAFGEMAQKSHVLEAAMWTLAAVAAVLGVEFYGAFILPALGIAALILLVDEFMTGLSGGKTVIGEFIDAFAGTGAAENFMRNLAAGWKVIAEEMGTAWTQFRTTWGDENLVKSIFKTWQLIFEDLGIAWGDMAAAGTEGWYQRSSQRGLDSGVETGEQTRQRRFLELTAQSQGRVEGDFGWGLNQRQYATDRSLGAGRVSETSSSMLASALTASAAPASVAAPAGAGGAAAGGGAVIVPVSTAAPTIHIHGMDEAKAERVARRALAKHEQDKAAAVGGRGRS